MRILTIWSDISNWAPSHRLVRIKGFFSTQERLLLTPMNLQYLFIDLLQLRNMSIYGRRICPIVIICGLSHLLDGIVILHAAQLPNEIVDVPALKPQACQPIHDIVTACTTV